MDQGKLHRDGLQCRFLDEMREAGYKASQDLVETVLDEAGGTEKIAFAVKMETIDCNKILIGRGAEALVFTIPGMDRFVLRIKREYFSDIKNYDFTAFEMIESPHLGDNVAHEIARIGPNVLFLEKKRGKSARFLDEWDRMLKGKRFEKEERERIKVSLYERHLRDVMSMTDCAFIEFAQTLQRLNLSDYYWKDYAPSNLLIDLEGGRFNLIEVVRRGEKYLKSRNSVFSMAYPILNLNIWKHHKGWSNATSKNTPQLISQVLRKILTAASSAGLYTTHDDRLVRKILDEMGFGNEWAHLPRHPP
jgi:hypothetical protein